MGLPRQPDAHPAPAKGRKGCMKPVIALLASWLIGSIPWAYLAGRVLKGVDLRKYGSGNLGTTNVLRLLGAPWAIVVYALDAAKGFVPVFFFPALFGFPPRGGWAIACGLLAILGHVRPVFLLLKGGGKGVATGSGVFFALTPIATFAALVGFLSPGHHEEDVRRLADRRDHRSHRGGAHPRLAERG